MSNAKIIEPQDGFQKKFLSNPADIVIGGGAAGAGKTFALVVEPLRHIYNPRFRGAIFRKNIVHIKNPGGLLDECRMYYPQCGGTFNEQSKDWTFPSGARISLRHIERYEDAENWQGTQMDFIGFDEVTHFDSRTFFYIITRARGATGIKPYFRATCNPDPDSWVADFIKWYIDQETGLPIKERCGKLRYFIRAKDEFIFGDSVEEVYQASKSVCDPQIESSGGLTKKEDIIMSLTFIPGNIYENKILIKNTPAYIGGLMNQSEDIVERLLHGNWKIPVSLHDIYEYQSFLGCFDNVREVSRKGKYITADIAMKGSNKFIVGYWEGYELMDLAIMAKSDGKDVINKISDFAKKYSVNNQYICYDADGVGSFIDGFIRGSVPFNGGIPAYEVTDTTSGKRIKENYFNLKTQCYYRSGERTERGELKISEYVANMMYDNHMTVRQRFLHERKAIKRDKVDHDGKLRIIPKEEMKAMLNGESPDLLDMVMMREIFDLKPAKVFADYESN